MIKNSTSAWFIIKPLTLSMLSAIKLNELIYSSEVMVIMKYKHVYEVQNIM